MPSVQSEWHLDILSQRSLYESWVERTFTVTGSNAGLLKDPLWYASKYGGFKDSDKVSTTGYNLPDKTAEWDVNGDGLPDTYFYAQNPLELEGKLAAAFAAILNQTSSGTAASVLSSSTYGRRRDLSIVFLSDPVRSREGNQVCGLRAEPLCRYVRELQRGYGQGQSTGSDRGSYRRHAI